MDSCKSELQNDSREVSDGGSAQRLSFLSEDDLPAKKSGNETVDLPEKLEQNSILLNNRTEAPESKLLPYQTILAVKEK